jgi:hypothetical protein
VGRKDEETYRHGGKCLGQQLMIAREELVQGDEIIV